MLNKRRHVQRSLVVFTLNGPLRATRYLQVIIHRSHLRHRLSDRDGLRFFIGRMDRACQRDHPFRDVDRDVGYRSSADPFDKLGLHGGHDLGVADLRLWRFVGATTYGGEQNYDT